MMYLEDMTDKYGFSDGAAVPPEAWELRHVYVSAINIVASAINSDVRAVAYNRSGVHNPCMILYIQNDKFKNYKKSSILSGLEDIQPDDICQPDPRMIGAIDYICDYEVDYVVTSVVSTDKKKFNLIARYLKKNAVHDMVERKIKGI